MGRAPCCDKVGLKKGPWTADEDEKLASYISRHGHGSWRALPKKAGLLRCGKSCRLRWTNYLRPDIKRGEFTALEEQTIIQLHALLGNRWSAIAAHLPKRTDNEIKNYWNTHLKKRLINLGLDPATHKPKTPISDTSRLSESPNSSHGSSSICHMTQWESARLEAEARLARESALRAKGLWPAPSSSQLSKPASTCDQVSSNQSLMDTMLLKQDLGGFISSSLPQSDSALCSHKPKSNVFKSSTSMELINSFQNWENSLQGQAGLMWPNSWRLSSRSTSASDQAGQQESSSCSSAQDQHMNHGSPTSTLCSFDVATTQSSLAHSLPSSRRSVKLSWSETWQQVMSEDGPARSYSNDTVGSRSYIELDDFQVGSKLECVADPPGLLSSIPASVQFHGSDNAATDVIGEEGGASSSLLDDLELTSQDICSSEKSLVIKIPSEDDLDHYWDNLLADSPRPMTAHESIYL
ncbi:hypothetical protein GOP47_0003630 [Adiantum capillus-veneris]|uniref:Uncharacterized protein n=1 Tax=Adiantum capillus-veneris TaxID=13818 RepID=A0A9D4V6N8_ADICA|nr:hypothetical protein GOP47_0003630 [Adiantum capillus-veneris]